DGAVIVGRRDDHELLDGDRPASRRPAAPGGAAGVAAGARDKDVVVSLSIHVQERRLARHRTDGQRGVWATAWRMSREALRRCAHRAGEHLVPNAVGPTVQNAIPDQPLLLRAVDYG